MIKEVDFSGKPNSDVIDHCERLLKSTKKGLIQGVMYTVVYDDGTTDTGWSKIPSWQRPAMLGSIFMAASTMQIQKNGVDEQDINR